MFILLPVRSFCLFHRASELSMIWGLIVWKCAITEVRMRKMLRCKQFDPKYIIKNDKAGKCPKRGFEWIRLGMWNKWATNGWGWDTQMAVSSRAEPILVRWSHHYGTAKFHLSLHFNGYHWNDGFIFCLWVSFLA